MQKLSTYLLLVLLAAVLGACTTSPTGRSRLLLISPQDAIAESQKAYLATVRKLNQENKLLDDPLLADRVRVITGRLVAEAVTKYPHSAGWKWSVALIDEPETINAWCMAGGRMAVYNGLFEKLGLTDAEFAQIMGHEISHALADHTAERMSVALATQTGLAVAGTLLTKNSAILDNAALAANLAIGLPNNRIAETEADQMGLELASRAGYDPLAAVSLWEKMKQAGGGRLPAFLGTHPSPSNRGATLAALAPRMRQLMRTGFGPPHPVRVLP